ncbi:MAG: LysM peptidoglycan-binding domain-containing protein, partial [Chloroflexi bacterium]|nr:LysM peptidoglycan-binding domain-containing protein [Chloroflexota bacterium]
MRDDSITLPNCVRFLSGILQTERIPFHFFAVGLLLAGCSIPTEVAGQAEPVVEAQAMGVAEAPTPTAVVRTGPTAEPTTVVGERVHIVEPGDTLLGIAALYGVSPQAIIAANNLTDPDSIVVGQ